jgi:PAS domain S-box-containing protein
MRPRPSLRRSFLTLLTLALAAFFALYTILFYLTQQNHLGEIRARDRLSVERFFQARLASDADLMSAALTTLSRDAGVRAAFLIRDRAALQAAAQPIFDDLRQKHRITHMYFVKPNREALLRMHRPEQFGDTIPRFTLLQAERTGRVAVGLELGQLRGLFTLRVVLPWRDPNNRIIGYLELGEEIEHLGQMLKDVLGVEVFVALRKDLLQRENWEAGMQLFGRTPNWSQFPAEVLVDRTTVEPPELIEYFGQPKERRPGYLEVRGGGRHYFGAAVPLLDVTARQVGEIVFLRDHAALVAATRRTFLMTVLLSVAMAVTCTVLLYERARRYYIAPLLELRAVAQHAGRGELSQDAIVHRSDEIGDLARSLNRMIHDLRAAQAEQTRLVLDAALDAVVTFDPDGQVIDWNRRAEDLFGWPRAAAIGRSILDLVGTGDTHTVLQLALEEYRSGGNSPAFNRLLELEVQGRLAVAVPVELTITPVKSATGLFFSAFFRDVTERARLQEDLQAAQRLDAIGTLAGGIAHDFNNLITAIVGYITSMLDVLEPGSPVYEDAVEVRRAADRASALVQQLLAFARKRVVQPRILDVNQMVVSVERMLQRLIGDSILLDTQLENALWPVLADPVQLEQVLINLTVNARDAMPAGGRVLFQTANVMISGAIAADGAVPPGHYATLTVSDTGVGMDQNTLAHIFEPFFTTKNPGKGTGLGLATCYGTIKQAGGYIRVTSQVGRGTTFRIYLPRAEQTEAPSAERVKASRAAPTETVLLVEDEHQVRRLLERALKQQGYTIITATNGVQAIELSRQHDGPIHLLLTDVVMPEMGGREAADIIRRERPEIRVVFMSGYSEELVRLQTELTETAAFIAKPFAPDEMRRVVRDVLDAVPAFGKG